VKHKDHNTTATSLAQCEGWWNKTEKMSKQSSR